MIKVIVKLGEKSCPVFIGTGLVDQVSQVAAFDARKVLICTDENVAPLYLAQVADAFGDRDLATLILPAGEEHKTLNRVEKIIDVLIDRSFTRHSGVVALGGGVIGDMSGFAASCYLRGIEWMQVPTSLLAQVDAAVGGKTAVNHAKGKNLIGSFHQPRCVIVDVNTLGSLPDREFRAGLAEVIKYGAGFDADFFAWLEENLAAIIARDVDVLTHTVEQCCRIKAEIVSADERELGRRALLNLGHTFGHALETVQGYSGLLHGEAVAIGLVLAARLSQRFGHLHDDDKQRLTSLLEQAGLETSVPRVEKARLLAAIDHDKKKSESGLRVVVMSELGAAHVTDDIARKDFEAFVDECIVR